MLHNVRDPSLIMAKTPKAIELHANSRRQRHSLARLKRGAE
jgi:hypothetical protein